MHGYAKFVKRKHRLEKIRERKRAQVKKLAEWAIDDYIERQRRDFSRWKNATDAQLDLLKSKLPIKPPVWSILNRVQKICFLIGAREKRFFYINDTGTGKTLLAIALAMYFNKLGIVKRVLVLMPNRINKTDWWMEVEKHVKGKCKYLILEGTSEQKRRALETTDALLVFETYGGLIRMVSNLIHKKGKRKDNLEPDRKLVKWLRSTVDGGVLDESINVGNRESISYRVARQISKHGAIFFCMSGMPFDGKDPTAAWAQFFLVDGGETMGETLGLFRAVYFNVEENEYGDTYKFNKQQTQLFNKALNNRSIRFEAEGLPPVVPIVKRVLLPKDADAYVEAAKASIRKARGNPRLIENSFLRLRQISSGFIGYDDDVTGEKAKFVFDDNPKLELLLSILDTIRPDRKVIVHFDFTFSGETLQKTIAKELKIKPLLLYGKTKDIDTMRLSFNNDADARVLLLQNRFGVGPNLQAAQYQLFYESPVSATLRKQCERRVERQYSEHDRIFRYDLLCRGTADDAIYEMNKQGIDLFGRLVSGATKL